MLYGKFVSCRFMSVRLSVDANSLGPQIFDETEDDQYDFHGYSIRKFTINIYFKSAHFTFLRSLIESVFIVGNSLIAWEDRLRSHPAYISAVLAASRVRMDPYIAPSFLTTSF